MDINKLTLKEPNTVDDGESSGNFSGQTLNQHCDTDVLLSTNESPNKNDTEKKTFKRGINPDEDASLNTCEDQQQYSAGEFVKEQTVMDTAEKVCFWRFVLQSDACFAGFGEKEKIELMLSNIKEGEFIAKEYDKKGLRLKSSIVFDIIPQDDKSNIEEMETTVRAIKVGSLVWGPSKLINCGDGICKLRICCDLQQSKTSVNRLIGFMEDIKNLGQNVDIMGFKRPNLAIFNRKDPLIKRIKVSATRSDPSLMTFEEFIAKSNKTMNFDEGSEDFFNLVLSQEFDDNVARLKCTTDQAPTKKNIIQPLNAASLSDEEEIKEMMEELDQMKKIHFEELAAKLRRKRALAHYINWLHL